MKFLVIFTTLTVGIFIGLHTILENGSLTRYLDTHPDPERNPKVEYILGQYYYLTGDLQQSATHYLRITERYPKSPNADDAYFYYLQALDDMNTGRQRMADLYSTYIDRFPDGIHAEMVTRRIIYCRNAR